jgi:ribonuclease-3
MTRPRDDLDPLETALGHAFRDRSLLVQALTHRSYLHEHPETATGSNERLEFLGDAVLHFLVAEALYVRFPDDDEGHLTARRASLVCTASLAAIAESLSLAAYVRSSRGEATIDGRGRPSILADTLEALIAAVYRDAGIDAARRLVLRLVEPLLAAAPWVAARGNVKGRLQELIQARWGLTPFYRVVERSGPDHAERFMVEVVAGEQVLGQGAGIGKRDAEQAAARAALSGLGGENGENLEPANVPIGTSPAATAPTPHP